MKSYDFEYDGLRLSDMGYIICKFGSNGLQTISNGSQITFDTVSTLNGAKYELNGTEYSSCLEATFQICKNPCHGDDLEISFKELRDLMSWLNRKNFHKFKLLDDDYYLGLYFEASFNINRVEIDGKVYGLELNMITNRPFALQEPCHIVIKNLIANGQKIINDVSDEEGYIYPYMEITIQEDGDFSIYNDLDNRTTYIKNCVAGEVIVMDYPIIQSSIPSHEIQNDFNWVFFRIANTFRNKNNNLTISIPCIIKLKYSPIVKIGL